MSKSVEQRMAEIKEELKDYRKVTTSKRGPCWFSNVGSDVGDGYRQVSIKHKKYLVHRLAWLFTHGAFPKGIIRHTCHQPGCVRVEHMRDGTPKENAQDRVQAGRSRYYVLTEREKRVLKGDYVRGVPVKALAKRYGVGVRCLYHHVSEEMRTQEAA